METAKIERESFIFYRSWYEAVITLPAEVRAEVLTSIMEYALYGELTHIMGKTANTIFILIKPQLDANNLRYKNGCLGGAPERNQNAKKTTEKQPKNNQKTTEKQPKNNQKQPNDNDNDNDNDNENDNENEKNKIPPTPLLQKGRTPVLCAKDVLKPDDVGFELLERWLKYRRDIKKPYKSLDAIRQFWKHLEKLSNEDLKTATEIVETSIANQWTGVFEIKKQRQ